MKKYSYNGPLSGVSLNGELSENRGEVLLVPGSEVELPSDSPYTRALVARGHLRLVEDGKRAVNKQKNREDV